MTPDSIGRDFFAVYDPSTSKENSYASTNFCSPLLSLIHNFYNLLQKFYKKSSNFFICCAIPKRKLVHQWMAHNDLKAADAKRPLRPTQSNGLLYCDKAARLRQQPQMFSSHLGRPGLELLPEEPLIVVC